MRAADAELAFAVQHFESRMLRAQREGLPVTDPWAHLSHRRTPISENERGRSRFLSAWSVVSTPLILLLLAFLVLGLALGVLAMTGTVLRHRRDLPWRKTRDPYHVWLSEVILQQTRIDQGLPCALSAEAAAAYPALVARMGTEDASGRSADPMDVPRAIADIIALPAGSRPLRRAVHPGTKPQEAINRVSAETQLNWLGNSAFGPWVKAVHDG